VAQLGKVRSRLTSLALAAVLALAGASAEASPGARRRVVSTSSSIVILEPIRFRGATAALDPRSNPMLDTIAATFLANTDLELIEVRAYGPDAPAGARSQLGLARARRIVEALIGRGVAPARLRAVSARTATGGPEFVIVLRRSQPG
jgi:outer membrane protein OmpA-like peptidoglycan-associated protein